jgi:uncharacterized protein YndB with AHSA1/START domain
MNLEVNVKSIVQKPIDEVFNTIVDRNKITKYFVTNASADITKEAKITWEWKDFCAESEVYVLEIEKNKKIIFEWKGNKTATKVTMLLAKVDDYASEVEITESSYQNNIEGIKKVMQQTQGWTDFLCSLKAYLYTGINLRNGKMNE